MAIKVSSTSTSKAATTDIGPVRGMTAAEATALADQREKERKATGAAVVRIQPQSSATQQKTPTSPRIASTAVPQPVSAPKKTTQAPPAPAQSQIDLRSVAAGAASRQVAQTPTATSTPALSATRATPRTTTTAGTTTGAAPRPVADEPPTLNPFRGAARPGYSVEASGPPTNVAEIDVARQWVRETEQKVSHLTRDEFGQVIAGVRGAPEPTANDVALFDQLDEVRSNINDIYGRARDFDTEIALQEADRQFRQSGGNENSQVQYEQELALIEQRAQFNQQLDTLNQQYEVGRQAMEQSFQRAQNDLDRALQQQQLDEAQRSSQVLEDLQRQKIQADQDKFKLDLFMGLSQSPEMLFFLGQSGLLSMFGDLMGDGGFALGQMMENIGASQTVNAQQFQQQSSTQQGQSRFGISATTGSTNPDALLRGNAPRGIGGGGLDQGFGPGSGI
jgi:hypothetical protein